MYYCFSLDIDLRKASKMFAQHFSCGSSVTGEDEVVIQGDVWEDVLEFIPEKWPEVSSTSLCLAFPASVKQRKAWKMQPCCTQQPDYTVPRLPEAGVRDTLIAIWDKMLVPNGVCYRGVPLYMKWYV